MDYTVKRVKQYWYQIKKGRRVVALCVRLANYKWSVFSKSDSTIIVDEVEALGEAIDEFIAYAKKEREGN